MTQGQSQVNLLSINNFAKMCSTTPRALRFYEQKGLIKPAKIDEYNGYRYYEATQLREYLNIKILQEYQYSLEDIASVINSNLGEEQIDQELKKMKRAIVEKQKEYMFIKNLKSMMFGKVDLLKILKPQEIGPFQLFCKRYPKGEYTKIKEYLIDLEKVAKDLGLKVKKEQITFEYTTTFQPKSADLEVCLVLDGKVRAKDLPEGYYFKDMPKTKALTYLYTGPYEYLTLLYQRFYTLVYSKVIKLNGPVFEMYIYGAKPPKSKYDLKTLIGFPV